MPLANLLVSVPKHLPGAFAVYSLAVFLLLLAAACASEQAPQGGPRDQEGPQVIYISPPTETRYFNREEVIFYFDEFLNPGAGPDAVFISPLMEPEDYTVELVSKKLSVKFLKPLTPNTTYVLTLGQSVKDYSERNPLPEPVQYAFSTGAVIDSASVYGRIRNARTGKAPQGAYLVGLFDPDSVQGYDFRSLRPLYAAPMAEDGSFSLAYLAPGTYRILAFTDKNANFQYDLPSEAVAVADSSTLVLADTGQARRQFRTLSAFHPDTSAPRLNRLRWKSYASVELEFDEPILRGRGSPGTDTLPFFLPDTNGGTTVRLALSLTDSLSTDSFALSLSAWDTLGNRLDTTLQTILPPFDRLDSTFQQNVGPLALSPFGRRLTYNSPLPDTLQIRRYFAVEDTGERRIPLEIVPLPHRFGLDLYLPDTVDTTLTYQLLVDSNLTLRNSARPDSTLSLSWQARNPGNFGQLSGRLMLPPNAPPFLLEMVTDENAAPTLRLREPTFALPYVPPGVFQFRLVWDFDGNGRWSPGQLLTNRPPEPVFMLEKTVKIRPGWEYENLEIPLTEEAREALFSWGARGGAPDSLAPDSLAPDSLAPDSLAPDSLAPDTGQGSPTQPGDPPVPPRRERPAPEAPRPEDGPGGPHALPPPYRRP